MGWDNPGGGGGVALPLSHDDPAQISGVSPDDHHAQAHALGGADHSGGITAAQHGALGAIVGAHSHIDLAGIGIDDHHARDHSIIGATHTAFPGGTATFLRADATFAAPTAAAADPVYSPGSFTVVTETGRLFVTRGKLTGAQVATVQGTGRVTVRN